MNSDPENKRGFLIHKQYLPLEAQLELVDCIRDIVKQAPLNTLRTPFGKEIIGKNDLGPGIVDGLVTVRGIGMNLISLPVSLGLPFHLWF